MIISPYAISRLLSARTDSAAAAAAVVVFVSSLPPFSSHTPLCLPCPWVRISLR